MAKQSEDLPRPVAELEGLATRYETHDTSSEMDHGEWVDPRPMTTTSLRLPVAVVDALKELARERGVRYTTLLRRIVEAGLASESSPADQLSEINERLARIEAAVVEKRRQPATGEPEEAPTPRAAGSRSDRSTKPAKNTT